MKHLSSIFGLLTVVVLSIISTGCASKLSPSSTFVYDQTKGKIGDTSKREQAQHPTSHIPVALNEVVQISVIEVCPTELHESPEQKINSTGNREVIIYAKIYKNGEFQNYVKITDLGEHMTVNNCVVVQKSNIFSTTMDGSHYQIILKGYETDTKSLVRFLKRVNKTDVENMEFGAYTPGDTFTAGFKSFVTGLFDMVSSITGRSIADWTAKLGADKFFEHSIYVVPKVAGLAKGDLSHVDSSDDLDLIIIRNESAKNGKEGFMTNSTEPDYTAFKDKKKKDLAGKNPFIHLKVKRGSL